eukprot:TRINITY_DN1690_c0_g1_i1.p1 TRINITY_DN1690_c0_g1~~TRINITY_DN1690_c0_g1_i1.p1  ORF type:complete len:434 (-),score=123.56 TRINITY_DN1690_c0_g1_i1:16-1224(-)
MSAPPPPPPAPSPADLEHLRLKLSTHMADIDKTDWFEVDLKTGSSADVHALDWGKCAGFSASDEGSEGVLFIQFDDKSVVTVKGSTTEAADLFAADLATIVDIPIPDYRILKNGVDEEYSILLETLNAADDLNHPLKRGRHLRGMGKPVVSIIEFIKGKSLLELNPSEIFGKKTINTRGAMFCREIGKITLYDVVINNWDRLPLIWDNKGNPDNILFTSSRRRKEIHAFAIDNSITSIDPSLSENFSEYMDKVRYVINEVCKQWNEPEPFKNVRQSFPLTCASHPPSILNILNFFKETVFHGECDVGIEGMKYFDLGFVESILAFAKVTLEDITKIRDNIEKQVSIPLEKLPTMGLESVSFGKINLDFVNSILEIFREASPTLSKIQMKIEKDLAAVLLMSQ